MALEGTDRIPILKIGRLLLVTIQVDMHDRMAVQLQDDLTNQIVRHGAHGVLIDISGLELVDSFIGRMLSDIAAMARVLDAETVVVGMRPAVAITLVELGLSLPGVGTALTVERGMDMLARNRAATRGLPDGGDGDRRLLRRCRCARDHDVVRARHHLRQLAIDAQLRLIDQTKLVTAVSELARNTVVHGGGGEMTAGVDERNGRIGVWAQFEDSGPGIADVEQAMGEGFTTGNGLGLGLAGARRLVDEFHIHDRARRGHDDPGGPVALSAPIRLTVDEATQVAPVRRAAETMAANLGLDPTRRGQSAIVATELATNLVRHGGGGEIVVRGSADGGLEIVAWDRGPGIADLASSIRDGVSGAGGPGNGLGAVRRLATRVRRLHGARPGRGRARAAWAARSTACRTSTGSRSPCAASRPAATPGARSSTGRS